MINKTRKGCKDIWNAYMCEGADFSRSSNDIPFCSTTAAALPAAIIPWDEAKRLYRNALARGDKHFFCDAFVCWFIDDYKFDGPRGIWHDSAFVLKVLRHFAGAITPDFSTYQDFPEPLKLYNTYRMRVFGYWLGKKRNRRYQQRPLGNAGNVALLLGWDTEKQRRLHRYRRRQPAKAHRPGTL